MRNRWERFVGGPKKQEVSAPAVEETESSVEKEIQKIRQEQKELRQMLEEIMRRLDILEAREKAPSISVSLEESLKTEPEIEKGEKEYSLQEVERIAFEILDLIEPHGRGSMLAGLEKLRDWLKTNYPGVKAEPIGEMSQHLWLVLRLTFDEKNGIIVPALDNIIGPGVASIIEGGRYDGTQALYRANIIKLGRAKYDESSGQWKIISKVFVDL